MTMQLIATVTATGTSNEIQFDSIPQDATDLFLVASLRSAWTGGSSEAVGLRFNNSYSGTTERSLNGNGSSASSGSAAYRQVGAAPSATTTANTFGNLSVYIPNYTGAVNKSASADSVSENNATEAFQRITAYLQTTTSPITQLNLDSATSASNWVSGSIVSLYKITKGSDGIVTTS
jgi:hypothetical protein